MERMSKTRYTVINAGADPEHSVAHFIWDATPLGTAFGMWSAGQFGSLARDLQ